MADYRKVARSAALKNGIDPDIFERQIAQESGFNPNARSPAGALGIAQFMPATAAGLGINPHDPLAALNGAARLMASYVRKYGSYRNALVAYNAGPGRVGKALPSETQHYIATILGGQGGGPPGGTSALASHMASSGPPVSSPTMAVDGPRLALANLLAGQGQNAHNNPLFATGLLSTDPSQMVKTVLAAKAGTGPAVQHPAVEASGAPGHGKGVTSFEGHPVASWIAPALAYARQQGWKGTVTSGYRTYAEQLHIWNSGVRPAAKPGTSNHEFTAFPGGAVDATDAQTLSKILQHSKYAHLLVWAGAKDPVHFSHPHNGSY